MVGADVSLVEWRANDGGAAEAPRRVSYEHVGDAINAIKIKRGPSVTRQELWKNLTEHQSRSIGKGEAASDRDCIVIGPFIFPPAEAVSRATPPSGAGALKESDGRSGFFNI